MREQMIRRIPVVLLMTAIVVGAHIGCSKDTPTRQPVNVAQTLKMPNGNTECGSAVTVAAGKRLVVTHVSAVAYMANGNRLVEVFLTSTSGAQRLVIVPGVWEGVDLKNNTFSAVGQHVHVYFDSSIVPCAHVVNPSTEVVDVAVSGYLEDI